MITDAYRESIESAHAARVARLRSANGWLSLVGKAYLAHGKTTIGSASDAGARLPEGAPAHVGTIELTGNVARFSPANGVTVRLNGEVLASDANVVLTSDRESKADVLDVDGFILELMERGETFALRVRDHRQIPRPYAGIDSYPIDPSWNVHARFEPHASPKAVDLDFESFDPASKEQHIAAAFVSPGVVAFDRDGVTHRLEAVFEDSSQRRLFILFRDATSGSESYGLGRFVYAPLPGQNGELLIDFNLAMLPGCAFTTFATCPIPPRENRLGIAVRAGEREYLADPIGA